MLGRGHRAQRVSLELGGVEEGWVAHDEGYGLGGREAGEEEGVKGGGFEKVNV